VSQTTADYPSDPAGSSRSSERSRPTLLPVADGDEAPDRLSRDLQTITLANRVLASRVSELDAELHRQVAAVARLQPSAAAELQRNVVLGSLAELRDELSAWQSSRLFRWSSLPRRIGRRLRRIGRSR
jgi:hypothetical protein